MQLPDRTGRSPGLVIARWTARKAVRSGVLWGYIYGVVVASSALTYSTIYKNQAARDHLEASFGSNRASSALFGPATELQNVVGFTAFKTFLTLSIIGAVWGVLTSTRLLRGEEDAGRWELLLTGRTTRRGAAGEALLGPAAGVFTLWAVTAVEVTVVGRSSKVSITAGAALYFALCLVASAVMFVSLGVLTSQLAATRRQAAGLGLEFLGVSYALRMVADSGAGLHWMIWMSPLGWAEQLQPLTSPEPFALLPIAAFSVAACLVGVNLAGKRDCGSSILPDRATGKAHLKLLSGHMGLSARLVRPTAVAWWVAIGVTGLFTGLVAKAAGASTPGSSVSRVFSKLGAPGTGATTFLGIAFLIVAVLIAFVAAGQVTAAHTEESAGRLDHLLVRPLARTSWFVGRLLVAVAVLLVGGVVAGVFAWLGAASQDSAVGIATLLDAGLNVIPGAICVLGIGFLVVGVWPRATSIATHTLVGWSLFVVLVGGIGAVSHWIADTSVFHQMASAPATTPRWPANAAMVVVGVACASIGGFAFRFRDLQGE